MEYKIKNDNLLYIGTTRYGMKSYGGNQEWYQETWHKRAGCGPVSAANIIYYLGQTRDESVMKSYYTKDNKKHYLDMMDLFFKYITPGTMGVNKTSMFVDGMTQFLKDKDLPFEVAELSVDGFFNRPRDIEKLKTFIQEGLLADCPIGFLALSRGKETKLQNWHWITITEATINGNNIIATASDEGRKITFNLTNWYLTTRMHGGLVYLKQL